MGKKSLPVRKNDKNVHLEAGTYATRAGKKRTHKNRQRYYLMGV